MKNYSSIKLSSFIVAGAVAFSLHDALAEFTADSYIQDGLIAQWDGIDNAGTGTHDPNATTWKELKGDLATTATALTFINGNAAYFNGTPDTGTMIEGVFPEAIDAISNGNFTVDLYFKPIEYKQYAGIFHFGVNGADRYFSLSADYNASPGVTSVIGSFQYKRNHWDAANGYSGAYVPLNESHHIGCMANLNSHTILVDGDTISTHSGGNYTTSATKKFQFGKYMNQSARAKMELFGVRFYNRVLSSHEIAHNVAVDNMRFNDAASVQERGYRFNDQTGKIELETHVTVDEGVEMSFDGGVTWVTSMQSWYEFGAQVTIHVRSSDNANINLVAPNGDSVSENNGVVVMTVLYPGQNVLKYSRTITWQHHVDRAVHFWDTPSMWKDDLGANRLPIEGDIVLIPDQRNYPYGGSTIIVTNTTPVFKQLKIGRGRSVTLRNWMTQLRADEIILQGDNARAATINCTGDFLSGEMSNRVWIVADRLALSNSYSSISAKGYKKKNGPGWEGVTSPSGGGTYGGKAAWGNCQTYGSVVEPTDPGTGTWNDNNDGHGGGAVRIEVRELLVNGTISTTGGKNLYGGGNGSGGCVWITCETIDGMGTISANGGGDVNAKLFGGAGGGGGRISVNYDPEKQKDIDCQIAFSARGGLERSSLSYQRYNGCGNCGTLYFTDDIFLRRPMMKLAGIVYYGPDVTPVTSLSGDSRTLENTWLVITNDYAEVNFTGDLALNGTSAKMNGVQLTGLHTKVNIGGDLYLSGAQLRVDSGDSMSVAGNVIALDGESAVNSGELNFRAAPTNENDSVVRPVTIGGNFILNSYGGYIPRCDPTNGAVVSLRVRNFTVWSNATVYANEAGYNATGRGPGFPQLWTRGASHGGRGGRTDGGEYGGTKPYDDIKYPCMPGSSGRNSGGSGNGTGGGVVLIETLGRLRIDGVITANGSDGSAYCGAASGGAVQIHCKGRLSGHGSISANGGAMTNDSGAWGGAGGGGRVAIRYAGKAGDTTLTAEAKGGAGAGTVVGREGEDGTVFWRQTSGFLLFLQ